MIVENYDILLAILGRVLPQVLTEPDEWVKHEPFTAQWTIRWQGAEAALFAYPGPPGTVLGACIGIAMDVPPSPELTSFVVHSNRRMAFGRVAERRWKTGLSDIAVAVSVPGIGVQGVVEPDPGMMAFLQMVFDTMGKAAEISGEVRAQFGGVHFPAANGFEWRLRAVHDEREEPLGAG